jgi:hypothetical protein
MLNIDFLRIVERHAQLSPGAARIRHFTRCAGSGSVLKYIETKGFDFYLLRTSNSNGDGWASA